MEQKKKNVFTGIICPVILYASFAAAALLVILDLCNVLDSAYKFYPSVLLGIVSLMEGFMEEKRALKICSFILAAAFIILAVVEFCLTL